MISSASRTGVPAWQPGTRQDPQDSKSIECDLERAFAIRSMKLLADRGREIVTAGKACRYVFQLRSGFACRQRPSFEGDQAILDLYQPGDFIGLENLFFSSALDSILALTNVSYWSIDCAGLLELMKDARIALQLMRHITEEKKRVDAIATLRGQFRARERAAVLILLLWHRLKAAVGTAATDQKEDRAFLPLTQKQLADYLGLHVIHLNRALRDLRDSGALQFQNGVIVLKDTIQLQQIARSLRHSRCNAMDSLLVGGNPPL
jgi:CRP/FNR family transcriptional regulator, anaerobic regulatory protein